MMSPSQWIDLASSRLGGRALLANDEFFAAKDNLLQPSAAVFIADKYTDRGKWMDGWETRRRRTPGHDWCLLRLGLPGEVREVVVDTRHFKGNHPESCSLDAYDAGEHDDPNDHDDAAAALAAADGWRPLVPRLPLAPDAENRFAVDDRARTTHVRLNIFPDGGVARLRVRGVVAPDWPRVLAAGDAVDLAAVEHGGRVLTCSDQFFSRPINLLMPGRGVDMGDGWETRRRRTPGYDWTILALGRRGVLERVVVDTHHFKGNYPAACALEGCDRPDLDAGAPDLGVVWTVILPRVALGPHAEHDFATLTAHRPITHVRFNIYPDGGVSRLRLFGRPADQAAGETAS